MKQIIYESAPRFNKFYMMDLFMNELVECTEKDFDDLVIRFRHLYDMKYDGPNRQVFILHGEDVITAVRERCIPVEDAEPELPFSEEVTE